MPSTVKWVILSLVAVIAAGLLVVSAMSPSGDLRRCQATPEDEMGPFYRPGAPVREKIGSGYILRGEVLSAKSCQPLPAAVIEFWQAGPNGRYSDDYRAAIIADRQGRYRLETDAPPPYVSRPPHIHIRVVADGHQPLVTQHYLQAGETQATFDLVLVPGEGP